ncbi:type II toxin-antitoxin system VapC family toxin [Mesorhizobium sp. M7A.F.Ca.CA.001.09.2.1]|uniref:Ribonuclease VapC n=1 Tax=Mesorhizobium ciceri TaxID=39645 RepID=A0AB38TDE5_9HYPH|nr:MULTISPECIES: type II toxin-antitoxin system VapC family toxin [Mesorhizobium]RUY47939.1 type II toxin-antitoxin system VapC family toxin [Mesorhizobium sp. M7A.F.Ca.CA.001.13.2.1]RVA53374.1 type II toxin-antitoxin system VapC family toxin [Mesorhizobium sp. M7A.F.Ca.US.001.01.1.1]MDF3215462.1 type II toxin-antitoxin system VapC family toxin [Mesorhizobium ciceri]RUY72184.1 type II toxin-antitoxin system VapC family toxin [Mesorhizobium sp. M7A.F.Ca.CA.001.05.1.1]RUY72570.1 type II toxin-an
MSRYLIDTSILSAFAPGRPALAREVSTWITTQGEKQTLFVPAIAITEIEKGICKLYRAGATKRAESLTDWLNNVIEGFADQILAVDADVARRAGQMEEAASAQGKNPGLADILIAATAAINELTVITANIRHFEALDVWCWNILQDPPAPD